MPKVLISDKLSPRAAEIFKNNKIDVDIKVGMTPEELIACIGEYDGLAIRSATTVTPEVLKKAKNLKVVGRAGIGVDNVDIPAATAHGVVVMNTPFGNSITTAEHAIAMMFSVARKIPQANASTHAGKWEKSSFMGAELTSKTLGLIGCGNIGSIVADRAQGLKMHVIAYDPFLSNERAEDLNIEKVELDELLKRADFISLHTPLNDATRNILGKENLKKTKKGVFIVNCARGGLIDEAALKELADSGHIAGAAFDVFSEEPAKDNVLFGTPNIVCTPHLGASTAEAQENVALQVAEQISDYLNNGTVTNALNIPSVSAEDAKKLQPYLELADQLGSFAGQITESGVKGIKMEYEGQVSQLNTKPISSALLNGFLRPIVDSVNLVNAPIIAKERDIDVSEVKNSNSGDYQTLIRLTITTDSQERSISGTLFGGDKPRIVAVNDVLLEAGLGKRMLYIVNEDKPGLIGALGNLLGDAKINIGNFHLGRSKKKGDALALVEVDQPVKEAEAEKIGKLPSVKQVKILHF
jgi:D-3-phosphoglycerate dehydrogenase